jgi:cell division protein FtsB
MLELSLDLTIALALVLIAVVTFVANRIGVLPGKSIPVFVGALGAVFGLLIWRTRRADALEARLRELEETARAKQKELEEARKRRDIAEQELNAALARLEQQKDFYAREILRLRAADEAERQRIAGLSTLEVFEEYARSRVRP